MPWNGSGTFYRLYSWVSDKASGINITASRMDADTADIVTSGLNNTLTRDGQGQPTANLSMAGFKHTNCAPGVASTDYATVGQLSTPTSYNQIVISNTSATVRPIIWESGGSSRWQLDTNAAVETGSNVGSDLELWSYTDAGAQLTNVLTVTRATGAARWSGPVTVTAGGVSVVAGGISVGAGGLTVSAGGMSITGAVTLGTALTVANGGTGAGTFTANNVLVGNGTSAFQSVAPGANLNALVSNGTSWGSAAIVNSFNSRTGAISLTTSDVTASLPTTYGAVGTYLMAANATVGDITAGNTIAGSNLKPCDGNGAVNGSSPSGTWKAFGYGKAVSGSCCSAVYFACLWLRIS